jgi:hypothetical protein
MLRSRAQLGRYSNAGGRRENSQAVSTPAFKSFYVAINIGGQSL